jgi:creatinine deaminase
MARPAATEAQHSEFMAEAIREAELGISQGGLPIGAVLTRDNKVIARGHNRRVQEKNVILHGEMSCLRDAGLISFHDTVMYTTLSPCSMCAGAIGLFRLSLLVIGESVTFPGSKDILTQFGIPYIDLEDDQCISMMKKWRSVPANEQLWQGDIGH